MLVGVLFVFFFAEIKGVKIKRNLICVALNGEKEECRERDIFEYRVYRVKI